MEFLKNTQYAQEQMNLRTLQQQGVYVLRSQQLARKRQENEHLYSQQQLMMRTTSNLNFGMMGESHSSRFRPTKESGSKSKTAHASNAKPAGSILKQTTLNTGESPYWLKSASNFPETPLLKPTGLREVREAPRNIQVQSEFLSLTQQNQQQQQQHQNMGSGLKLGSIGGPHIATSNYLKQLKEKSRQAYPGRAAHTLNKGALAIAKSESALMRASHQSFSKKMQQAIGTHTISTTVGASSNSQVNLKINLGGSNSRRGSSNKTHQTLSVPPKTATTFEKSGSGSARISSQARIQGGLSATRLPMSTIQKATQSQAALPPIRL